MSNKIDIKPIPPKEAIEYFRKKGYKTSFNWYEMQREEHVYNFTVAKVAQLDLLEDIRKSVDDAISKGTTLNEFQKNLTPTLIEKGWWGKKMMIDPNTGEEKEVQLGSPRRLKTIFETNLRSAYAAGRWERIQRTKAIRPYLRYSAVLDNRTRDQHRAFNDIILPIDDPFWDTHYPPNGWRCRCSVQQLGKRDLTRLGLDLTKTPPLGAPRTFIDKRTGDTILVPMGVDPAFAYNVGKARMKGIMPPQLDAPLKIPFSGDLIKLPMPSPQNINIPLLEDGKPDEFYVSSFLKEFKGDIGKPVLYKDASGDDILISDDLFKTSMGKWKVKKRGRHQYILYLAQAIKNPDEIFTTWLEKKDGTSGLYRVYLSHHQNQNSVFGFSLFCISSNGWIGLSSFTADTLQYLKNNRRGSLIYRRIDEKK